jgi:hypothetical protein
MVAEDQNQITGGIPDGIRVVLSEEELMKLLAGEILEADCRKRGIKIIAMKARHLG